MAKDSGQAGASYLTVEVSSAMVDAGASVLRFASLFAEPSDGGRELASDVFRAMAEASSAPLIAE